MADTRTIEITVKTDKAEKNIDSLGKQMDKTRDKSKQYQHQIGENSKAMGGMLSTLKRLAPALLSLGAVYKGLQAVVKTNVELSIALEKAQAGLGAVTHTVTADIGQLAAEMLNLGEGQTLASKATEWFTKGLQFLNQATGTYSAELDTYNLRLQENIRIAEEWVQMNHDLRLESARAGVEIAKLNTEFQKARFNARDDQNDLQTRMQAQAQAEDFLRQRFEAQTALQEERIRLAQKFYDGTEEGTRQREEAEIKLQGEIVKLQQLETAYYTERRTLVRDGIRLNNEYQRSLEGNTQETERQITAETGLQGVQTTALKTQQQLNAELAKKNDLIQKGNNLQEENNELGEEGNATLQGTVGSLDRLVNLFSEFSFRNVLGILFTVLNLATSFTPAGAVGGFFGRFLGFAQGRRGMIVPEYGKGGLLNGPSHEQGGIKYALGGKMIELEGGEAVINKRSMSIPWVRDLASNLNQIGGGVKFANGGITPSTNNNQMFVPVLVTEDFNTVNDRVQVLEDLASI